MMTYDKITNEVSTFCGQVKQITMVIKIKFMVSTFNLALFHSSGAMQNYLDIRKTYENSIYLWKVAGNSKLPYS